MPGTVQRDFVDADIGENRTGIRIRKMRTRFPEMSHGALLGYFLRSSANPAFAEKLYWEDHS